MSKYVHIESWWKVYQEMAALTPQLGFIGSEKIDGSNFSILAQPDGYYSYRSKNQELTNSSRKNLEEQADYGMFGAAIKLADQIVAAPLEMARQLNKTVVLYFEFYGAGIQKRINYDVGSFSIDGKSLIFVDACFKKSDDAKSGSVPGCSAGNHDDLWWNLDNINPALLSGYNKCFDVVKTPKTIFIPQLTAEVIEKIRLCKDEFSWLEKSEGLVIRPLGRNRSHFGELLQTKVKTEWYEKYEKRGGENTKTVKDLVHASVIDFVFDKINNGRLNSIYSHGHLELKKEMADMKYLPALVFNDIFEETKDAAIWAEQSKEVIQKTISKRLPIVLKGWLANA